MGTKPQTPPRNGKDSEEISRHLLFESLQNRRRRLVLEYLIENDKEAVFSNVVNYVASKENSVPFNEVTPEQKNRVRTTLYQHHLDKLERSGLITYQKRDGVLKLACDKKHVSQYIGSDTLDWKTTVGYGFGAINLGLGASLYLLGMIGMGIGLTIGFLGMVQLLTFFAMQHDVYPDILG